MTAKTKVLSLALLGLAGFGFAGSALAGCPASPVPPWTANLQIGGTTAIVAGGYAGTPCRLDAAITGDAASFAAVEDDSPAAEPRYRVQFMINVDNLTSQSPTQAVYVFEAQMADGTFPVILSLGGDGAGNHFLGYLAKDSNQTSGYYGGAKPLASGPNYVEFDYDNGAVSGAPHFSLWINNNVEATPTDGPVTIASTSVTDTAYLGLIAPSVDFASGFSGTTVGFDQFDSRRQTFIGY